MATEQLALDEYEVGEVLRLDLEEYADTEVGWLHWSDLEEYVETTELGRLLLPGEGVETGSWLRGTRTYAMMAELEHPSSPTPGAEEEWSDEKNTRRCELIEKEIDGSISDAEREELGQLQAEVDEYVRRVAPRPLNEIEEIKRLLLRERSSGERTT
jgi:hypothetical protein